MSEQDILSFLQQNGPTTPAQLAKHINVSLLFASAMLGDVSGSGKVKITNLKIGGGSPLYYLKEHADKLQNFADKLNAKDREAYDLLKERKVLRDGMLQPIIRVSLRAIKDFAVPLIIIRNDTKELFWKWYLLTDKDAEEEIKKIFDDESKSSEEKKEEKSTQESIAEGKAADNVLKKEEQIAKKDEKLQEAKAQGVQKQDVQKSIADSTKANAVKKEPIREVVRKITPKITLAKAEEQKQKTVKSDALNKNQTFDNLGNITPLSKDNNLNVEFVNICKNTFAKKIVSYFDEKKITILSYEQIKKNKEYRFMLKVPSAIGFAKYICKATDKKKVDEGELALALIEGQYKQMPVIYISTGIFNKNSEERLNTLFKDLVLIKL